MKFGGPGLEWYGLDVCPLPISCWNVIPHVGGRAWWEVTGSWERISLKRFIIIPLVMSSCSVRSYEIWLCKGAWDLFLLSLSLLLSPCGTPAPFSFHHDWKSSEAHTRSRCWSHAFITCTTVSQFNVSSPASGISSQQRKNGLTQKLCWLLLCCCEVRGKTGFFSKQLSKKEYVKHLTYNDEV